MVISASSRLHSAGPEIGSLEKAQILRRIAKAGCAQAFAHALPQEVVLVLVIEMPRALDDAAFQLRKAGIDQRGGGACRHQAGDRPFAEPVLGLTSEFRERLPLFGEQDALEREQMDEAVLPCDLGLDAAVEAVGLLHGRKAGGIDGRHVQNPVDEERRRFRGARTRR